MSKTFNKIFVGEDLDNLLRSLKARTGLPPDTVGLSPNILCRLALCLSLETPGEPDLSLYDNANIREFNRYTLTGQWDKFFSALLRQRLLKNNIDLNSIDEPEYFKAHLSRGISLLAQRVKRLEDIGGLM
jgi:DNA sulfur modification protein DndE